MDILVCSKCGSADVHTTAGVNSNTNEYQSEYDGRNWCTQCEENVDLITKSTTENDEINVKKD